MSDSLAAVLLSAGAGSRLRPLTLERPKPLCPVGGVALLDLARARAASALALSAASVAVNVHAARPAIEAHVTAWGDAAATVSVEEPRPLGTAGALGRLRDWIDGRDALVLNSDAYLTGAAGAAVDLAPFVDGWDRERVRLLGVADPARADFGSLRYAGAALMPAAELAALRAEPSGLYEASWRRCWAEGRLELVSHAGTFLDCGTPAAYLAANLHASGGASVVDPTARVEGVLTRCVLWDRAVVVPGERLTDAVRTAERTVLVR